MECYERTCCVIGLGYLDCWNGTSQRVLEYIFCNSHWWLLERIFGGRKTNADGGVAMKTPEDEAFEDIERRQGGGFPAKRAMAADKFIAAEERKVGERYGYVPKLHPSEWMDEPAQEPVAWAVQGCSKMWFGEFAEIDAKAEAKRIGGTCYAYPLYTTPPQRPWVGMTDEETSGFTSQEMTVVKYVNLILKEKNT
jgi:hypothetical protein